MRVKNISLLVMILTALSYPISSNAKSNSKGTGLSDLVLPAGWSTGVMSPCATTIQSLRQCGSLDHPLALSYKGGHSGERLNNTTWGKWEVSLDEHINNSFSKRPITDVGGRLLVSQVHYGVTNNGEIVDIQVSPAGNNAEFESLILSTLLELSKSELVFPAESDVSYVKRVGYFVQNYGPNIIAKKRREASRKQHSGSEQVEANVQ